MLKSVHRFRIVAVNRRWRNHNRVAAEPFISLYVCFFCPRVSALLDAYSFCIRSGDHPRGVLYEIAFVLHVPCLCLSYPNLRFIVFFLALEVWLSKCIIMALSIRYAEASFSDSRNGITDLLSTGGANVFVRNYLVCRMCHELDLILI